LKEIAVVGAGYWGKNLIRNFFELGALKAVCDTQQNLVKSYQIKLKEGEKLAEFAEKTKKILMVGHILRYHPAVNKLKELINQGELGKIQYIYSNRLNIGKIRNEGNILWSFAPHDISTILFLLAHIFVSWLHPFKEQKLVVVGSKKMALFDDVSKEKLFLYPHKIEWEERLPVAYKAQAEPVSFQMEEPLKLECQHFLNCIEKRLTPKTDAQERVKRFI